MNNRISRALPRVFGILGAGVLVTGSLLTLPSLVQIAGATGTPTPGPPTTTHHVQPIATTGNITSCPSGTTFLVTSSPVSGTYSTGATYFDVTVTSTLKYLSFTTDSPSFTVYVKGGNAYDTYDYTTTAYPSDTGLHAPLVGTTNIPDISHYVICGQPAVTPVKATPTLTTGASGPTTLGSAIHDTATLTGGNAPTGTITFKVFSTTSCATPITTFVTRGTAVSGTGTYTSASFTPAAAGTYYWTARYSGDTNNNSVTEPCGAPTESSTVTVPAPPARTTPTLSTTAGTVSVVGTASHDTATLSGGNAPTGTITFKVFNTTACHSAVPGFVTTGATVKGTGNYVSASFVPTAAGTYYWTASYSGDAHNNPVTEPCGGQNESVLVKSSAPATGAKTAKLEVVKSSTPPSGSSVAPSTGVTYTLALTDTGTGPATDVTVTDTVPAGTSYVASSATCNGIAGCNVSERSGKVTWTGIDLAAGQTVTVSFGVTVNTTDTNGQKIDNVAMFTNEGTPHCTAATCHTNTVTLTVVRKASAATSSTPPSTVTRTPTLTTTPTRLAPTAALSTPTRISEATTVHTGEPWAGSLWAEIGVLGAGLSLLGIGEWLRRRRPRHAGQ